MKLILRCLILFSLLQAPALAEQMRIALILMGQTHDYWHAIREGAQAAADRQGAELLMMDPLYENQSLSQEGLVQRAIALKVKGIIIAPSNKTALVPAVQTALDTGIKTVLVDSGLDGRLPVTIVNTDNFAAGKTIGELIRRELPEDSKVVLLGLPKYVESTLQRIDGAEAALADYATVERYHLDLLSMGEAHRILEQISISLMQADAVFACNESSTLAMLDWFKRHPQAPARLYGFDMAPTIFQAVENNRLQGVMLQDPYAMGAQAVDEVVRQFLIEDGASVTVSSQQHIPSFLLTPGQLKQGDVKPQLQRYLPKRLP